MNEFLFLIVFGLVTAGDKEEYEGILQQ